MTKQSLSLLLTIFLFAAITGCQKLKEQPGQKLVLNKENISGESLWTYVTEVDNYKQYPSWPDWDGLRPGQAPHARFHEVFIHPVLREALPIRERIAPYGSIIVKENYSDDKELVAYTLMAKIKDYDRKNNDWFWAKYTPKGEVMVAGKVDACISCHASSNNDFILLQPLDNPLK